MPGCGCRWGVDLNSGFGFAREKQRQGLAQPIPDVTEKCPDCGPGIPMEDNRPDCSSVSHARRSEPLPVGEPLLILVLGRPLAHAAFAEP